MLLNFIFSLIISGYYQISKLIYTLSKIKRQTEMIRKGQSSVVIKLCFDHTVPCPTPGGMENLKNLRDKNSAKLKSYYLTITGSMYGGYNLHAHYTLPHRNVASRSQDIFLSLYYYCTDGSHLPLFSAFGSNVQHMHIFNLKRFYDN